MNESEVTRTVGDVAAASGVTVRTLHHWDAIGVISPSSRTGAGHRLYTEDDLHRLYQVLSLRRLGLPLEQIAACLDSDPELLPILRAHSAGLEATIASLREAHRRLAAIEGELAGQPEPDVEALLAAVRSTEVEGDERLEALRRQLDDEQIEDLADRTAALGDGARHALQVEWPELYRRAAALRAAGRPPADPEVRKLVARMDELSAQFNGGDASHSKGVRAAWRAEPEAMSGQPKAATDARSLPPVPTSLPWAMPPRGEHRAAAYSTAA